ncbi:helix-turn-helix domain-containing protein [Streptomyces ipomoeae]|uniref:Insertion element IS150 protein InsJ-like helix-turn-helix domain-containing protein n=1 Tax=Streptomyces ipomoeae 91-03 TaxID=698759 RepID=L1KHW7_9ACTN|nr:hypothetical protein STRIP9103_09466 [Streptomyces ipomoeae 91-03]MDX2695078.1 helix-turn-helix domain-containing protein [Streptomyces ipomoeae]MDX2819721.1 helix-turn-helix domain-containing protein [Streptomyces ipomoeae]MDX2838101.1 helix-turn-helix domain-containing protein [Streptomyces ipomoeae]MDX2874727.1 helix-turn-helix domain-containing protein [Streptomyces ipomoeae]
MAERVRVREIEDDEGRRLLRIIRRGTGSAVTWRRAQMVLPYAQGMPVVKIAEVAFTSADRARDVIHNFNADGFEVLYPKYEGGRPGSATRTAPSAVTDQSDLPLDALITAEGATSAITPATPTGSRTSSGCQATPDTRPGREANVAAVSCPTAVAWRTSSVPRNPLPPMIRTVMDRHRSERGSMVGWGRPGLARPRPKPSWRRPQRGDYRCAWPTICD